MNRVRVLVVAALCACSRNTAVPQAAVDSAALPPPAHAPSFTAAAASPAASEVPASIRCLARYYTASADHEGSAWFLRLPDGTKIPQDDGKTKSAEERMASPDVDDVFAVPYSKGPIKPVVDPDDDPGRVRIEAVLRATYGATATEVVAALVDVSLRGHTVRVHRKVEEPFRRVAARLDEAARADPTIDRFFRHLGGTFNWRVIAGTDRTSAHAWGFAIDLDPALSHYWRNDGATIAWKNSIPQAIVDAFEAEGFIWGGRWFHYDTMHFEYRPEMLDPSCAPRP